MFGETPPDLDLFPTSGSSNGQKDFANDENHFGAGDIPFKTTNTKDGYVNVDYTTVNAATPFYHIPFQLGAIGIFHSVPDSAGSKVDLDGCTLAKIFSRQIKFWDHADIKALNPTLNIPANTPIKVATRTAGSSSTSLTTAYLDLMAGASSTECANTWTLGSGSTITWPADVDKVEGSSGMSGFLAKNEWSIGYVDAGHGHEKGLKEVELKNKNGKWVTSKTADIAAAGDNPVKTMPTVFSDDWNGFDLMNAAGDETFPICTFSYMYIHKSILDSESARLLQAFATFVLSDEGQGMLSEFGFVKLSTATLAKSRAALAAVTYTGVATAPWEFETATGKGNTAGTWPKTASALSTPNDMKIFSVKRGAWGDYARGVLESDLDKLVARVAVLEGHHDEPLKWYEDPKKQIDGALALGSLAFILGFIGTVLGGVALTKIKRMSGGKYSNNIV